MIITNLLKIEEFAMFLIYTIGFIYFGGTWLQFFVFLLAPDISMIGYIVNPLVGSWTYNIFHNKGLGLLIFALGITYTTSFLVLAGLIILAHSSMDRVLGYGLKYPDSFFNTHLGRINGKK